MLKIMTKQLLFTVLLSIPAGIIIGYFDLPRWASLLSSIVATIMALAIFPFEEPSHE